MATAEPDLGEECHKNCSTCPKEASSFCQDCDKYFCATCLPVHNGLLTGHTVLGSDQRSEWGKQKEKKTWKRECKEHAGQMTCMYCSKHDIVCCPVCAVKKHGFGFGCYLTVSYIPDIAKGLSGSQEYRAHLDRIDKVTARFNATEQKLRERGRSQLHDSKVKGTKVMKELIERIDKLLNALVIGSLKKLESTVDGLEKANEREIDDCVTHAEELAAMKKELSNSENSDEVEMFICMKTSQKQISKLDVILDALENKPDCPTEISVDDKVEKAVKLLEKAESLGTLPSIQKQEKPISKGFSGNEPAAQAAELSPTDLVVSLAGEVTQWEAGMMWPFTCFGFEKENITLPGFTDLSFEELRFEAYEAKHSGTMAVYIQKVQALYQEVNTRRQELKAPNMTMKQKLISFIEGCRKQTQSSSGNQAPLFSCDDSGQKDTTRTTKVPPRQTKTVRSPKIIKPVQKRAGSSFSGISTTSTPLFGTSISSTRNTLSTVSPISGVSTTTSSILEATATVSSLAGSTTTTATTTMACDLEKTNSMCAASATRSSTVGTPTTSGAPAVTTSMSGTQTAEKTMPPGLNTGARGNSSRTDNLSLLFHQVHGKGVELSGDSKQAKRDVCIFDCSRNVGICFSNRPIAIGEYVYVKFEKDSLSTNSLYVGLTRTDPGSLNDPLPNSWISMGNLGHLLKLVEGLPKDTFKLFFYITRQGVVFYGVDEKEIGWLFHGIETNIPYWAMIDIRGLGWDRSIEFVKPSIQMEDSMGADQKGTRTSACIPTMGHQQFKQRESKETRNEKSLDHPQHCQANTCTDSSPILLHTACRKNVSVSDDQMTATKQMGSIDQGYFFTTRPMEVKETLVFEMQDTGESHVGYFSIGFTFCDPATLQPEDLPDQELLLRERAEYWALSNLEVIMDVGTKFHLYLTENGQLQCCTKKKPPYATNNHAVSNMMVVDTSQPVWAFFVMRGDLQKIKIIAHKDIAGSTGPQPEAVSSSSSAPSAAAAKPSLFQAVSSPASSGPATTPGAAASMLSQLAAKHQENTSTTQTSSPAAPATTHQKTILGGFSFTSTAKITEQKAEKQKGEVKATSTADAPKYSSGFSKCHVAAEFGPDYFKGIAGPDQTISTHSPPSRKYTTSTGSDDHVDEYEPDVVFKPAVPLPDLASKEQAGSAVSQPGAVSAPSSVPTSVPSAAAPKPSLFPAASSPASSSQATMPGAAASMLSQHRENTSTAQASSPAAPATTPQKTILGGFSFTSTPKINEPKAEKQKEDVKPTATADAPKPFSGFSFTTPTQSPAQPPSNQTTSTASPGVFGQMSAPSFGSLAAGGQTAAGFGTAAGSGAGDFKGFAGAGQSMFTKAPSPRRHNTSTGSDDHVNEYEPNVDFKPVVPLPDLVEVKTGEEDEEKMFGERAKLFRYDTESKQWKERGIGEIKILRHKTTNVHRILMRREQVLKLCANHKITKDLKLATMATSEKAWVWTAADFSEGEVKTEKLAVRFKNQDIAVNFKKTVEACQETMNAEEAKVDEKKTEKKEEKKAEKEEKKAGKKEEKKEPSGKTSSLASMFKQKAGSWTCTVCYVPNGGDILQCPCCNTMKPGVTKEDLPKKETPANTGSSGSSGFTFGSQEPIQANQSRGFSLAPKPTDSTSSQPQTGGFKFGSQPSDAAATSAPQTGGFMFGSSASTATSTAASASPFGKPAATTSAPSSALSTFGDTGTSSEAPNEPASSSGFGFNLPEPGESTAATSVGFNLNKDASKYTFGENSKPVEEKTQEKQTPDVSDSLLAKYLSAPDNATADGENATSDGENATADGENATSGGENTTADGENATSGGENATADGENATADGENTTSGGENATADGENATADGENTTSGGENATADGEDATADGENTTADDHDKTDDTGVVKKEEAGEIVRINCDKIDENKNISTGKITLDDNEIVVKEENNATAEDIAQTDDVVLVEEEHASPDEVSRARELQLPDHFFLYRLKPACTGCRGCEEDYQKSSDQADEEEGAAHNNDDYDDNDDDDDDEEEEEEKEEEKEEEEEEEES